MATTKWCGGHACGDLQEGLRWKKPKRTWAGRDARIPASTVIEVDPMCDGENAALCLGLMTAVLAFLAVLLQVALAWLQLQYQVRKEGARRRPRPPRSSRRRDVL